MRKLIAIEFVTLDGVIQAPGRPDEDSSGGFAHGGWISGYADTMLSSTIKEQMAMPFDLLLGRRTFDIWASYWPEHSDIWPNVNKATKYVASRTIRSHTWQPCVFLDEDLAGNIRELKERPGPDLHVYGSANLLQTLLKHDLVDALWLKIFPISLGTGKRLFAQGAAPTAFKVARSKVSECGVIIVDYERAGAIQS
jgi:dihydrofolate reductase